MLGYAKVLPRFWRGGSGKKLRGDVYAQLVALYLFSAPDRGLTGIFYLSLPTMAHDVGCSIDQAKAGLTAVQSAGIALYDAEEELIFLPAMARIQLGEELPLRDNRIKALERELSGYRDHPFYDAFLARYQAAYHLGCPPSLPRTEVPSEGAPKPLAEPPLEGPSKPLRSQEQEQDQGQEHSKNKDQIPPECVDPVPVTTRAREPEPPPTHTRESPRVEPPLPTIAQIPQGPPSAEQLELLLCAHAPTRLLADRPYPERIAGQCMSSGIPYAIVRAAIEDFAQKHAATAPDMRLDALASALGGFINAAKKQASTARLRAEEQARGDPAARKVLEEFDGAWRRSKGTVRVHDARDEHHAAEVLRLATEAASRAVGSTPEAIVSHVIARHLDERDPLVAQSDHALRLLPARMSSYGLPAAPRPKKARERPGDMGISLEEANRARDEFFATQRRRAAS